MADIDAAFNNVTTLVIQHALFDLDIEKVHLGRVDLGNNSLSKTLVDFDIVAFKNGQRNILGRVNSLLLWLAIVNLIFIDLDHNVLCDIMSNYLDLLNNWATV